MQGRREVCVCVCMCVCVWGGGGGRIVAFDDERAWSLGVISLSQLFNYM